MQDMSEAGKEAVTRDSKPAGVSMPLRTISRMAPNSVQLAKDHALLAKSLWCGIVFSLALLITVINVLPPVGVGYRISTQVLASPQRLALLNQHLAEHRAGITSDDDQETVLLSVAVLDDDSRAKSGRLKSDKEPLMLLEVVSHWRSRTDSGRVHRWLSDLTKTDERTLRHFDAARAQRFARWEVQAHEHYLKHYRHTRSHEDADNGGEATAGPLQLTSATDRVPTKFASLSNPEIVTSANAAIAGVGASGLA
jgi:hypothetical protein